MKFKNKIKQLASNISYIWSQNFYKAGILMMSNIYKLGQDFKLEKERQKDYLSDLWGAYDGLGNHLNKLEAEIELLTKNCIQLRKELSTEKRRITRQTNEQNKERRAFLKLIGKTEKDLLKVINK